MAVADNSLFGLFFFGFTRRFVCPLLATPTTLGKAERALLAPHSVLASGSVDPGPACPRVCATSLEELHEEQEEEEEEEEVRVGDLLGMEAATAADTSPTPPGAALSKGRPAWLRKSGEVTMLWLPVVPAVVPSTRLPLASRLVIGRLPPLANATKGEKNITQGTSRLAF